jgi:hypothetical protein
MVNVHQGGSDLRPLSFEGGVLTTRTLFRIGIILLPRLCQGEASDGGCIIESVVISSYTRLFHEVHHRYHAV